MRLHIEQATTEGLDGLSYVRATAWDEMTAGSVVHIITYDQALPHLKLIVAKASEALNPDQPDNHLGEGGTLAQLVRSQPDIRFVVNGTYSHYRKGYYPWRHDDYAVGDPVGLVRIRDRQYDDNAYDNATGYLQSVTGDHWDVVATPNLDSKYVLSSRPMLRWAGVAQPIPADEVVSAGEVNPPSFLGHGLQLHARTAVGLNPAGELVFIVVECTPASAGMTLPQLQTLGDLLDLQAMLNLDGGGSSRFWLLSETGGVMANDTEVEDMDRVLGHVLMLFSGTLRMG